MNIKRMLKMADKIEKLKHMPYYSPDNSKSGVAKRNALMGRLLDGKRSGFFFNMASWSWFVPRRWMFSNDWGAVSDGCCGTAGCIAGSIIHFAKIDDDKTTKWPGELAADYLGLTSHQASLLFEPNLCADLATITPKQAARAMRLMVKGKNPWPGFNFRK